MIEIELAQHIADKTNWRTLLKQDGKPLDLPRQFAHLQPLIAPRIAEIKREFGDDAVTELHGDTTHIAYPLEQHPQKIISHNFDKNPHVSGILQGIKGQYLIFDTGVINIRKFTAYEIEVVSE